MRCSGLIWLIVGLLAACVHGPAHQEAPRMRPEGAASVVTSILIFDTKIGENISEDALKRRFIETPWLLWGEQHDQVQHHALRAGWLADWAGALPANRPDRPEVDVGGRMASEVGTTAGAEAEPRHGRQAAIVFEQLDRAHGAALKQVQARQPKAPLADWLAAGGFDARRWGGEAYQPLFEAAWRGGVPWVAGNLSREAARQWMMMSGTDRDAGANGAKEIHGADGLAGGKGVRGADGVAGAKGAHRADWVAGAKGMHRGGGATVANVSNGAAEIQGGGAAASQGAGAAGQADRHERDAGGEAASTAAWLKPRLGAYPAQPADAGWLAALQAADWDGQAEAQLLAAIRVGHCDALPESMLVPMASVQRLRDAALADALKQGAGLAAVQTSVAVEQHAKRVTQHPAGLAGQHPSREGAWEALPPRLLLAGNGHVDKRFGVPRYLGIPGSQVLVVGMETVSAAALSTGAPSPRSANGQVPTKEQRARRLNLSDWVGQERASRMAEAYDVVVLTPVPSTEVPDHCAVFRQDKGPAGKRKAAGQAIAP